MMKHTKSILSLSLAFTIAIVALAGCSGGSANNSGSTANSTSQVQGSNSSTKQDAGTATNSSDATASSTKQADASTTVQITDKDKDGDGIPDAAEKILGTNPYSADTDGDGQNDKIDKDPTFAENPINETSTTALPIKIKDARVEDNATADHLEITVTNIGPDELKNFDIYYTVTDKVDNKKEAYYQKLDGFTIKAGETKTLHFDNNLKVAGHYPGNMNGLYGTSKNELFFDVLLHSTNYQPCSFQVKKAKGTAEVAD